MFFLFCFRKIHENPEKTSEIEYKYNKCCTFFDIYFYIWRDRKIWIYIKRQNLFKDRMCQN